MSAELSPYTGSRYWFPHVAMKPSGQRLEPWCCRCGRPRYKRHTEPHQCLTDADLLPWYAAHPEYTGQNARRLAYLEYEFDR